MDEATERRTGRLAGWVVDCKDRLAGIAEWLSDYVTWLTGWTVDQLDKRSHTLNPAHLFLCRCQTAVRSVRWPVWEMERGWRDRPERQGERDKERETELDRDIESCRSISTLTARRLLLIT